MTVKRGAGGIRTREDFCDVQLHLEWRTPEDTAGMDGQDRGNSGVFLQERYEIQVLDSYDNETYPNGQAASIYKQHIPLVNASRPPGEWQSYDIIYTAPRFDDAGELESPAYATVLHNGVLVQNHVEIQAPPSGSEPLHTTRRTAAPRSICRITTPPSAFATSGSGNCKYLPCCDGRLVLLTGIENPHGLQVIGL